MESLCSLPGEIRPAVSLKHSDLSTYNGGLTGEGADTLTAPVTALASGLFVFGVPKGCGQDLRFVLTGAAATTAEGRIWVSNMLPSADANNKINQWTKAHLCDFTVAGSATAVGIDGGLLDSTMRWCSVALGDDGGLLPAKTRVMQSTLAGTKGRLIVDGVCEKFLIVQMNRLTATSVGVLAMPWMRS